MKRAITSLILCVTLGVPLPLPAEEIVINAVGDIMLAGRWAPAIRAAGYDTAFDGVATELRAADITIANLESPIARGGAEFTGKRFRFRAEPGVAGALKRSGINLVTLANNHSMDFGGEALAETLLHLDAAGISHIGAGEDLSGARSGAYYTVRGKRIAFLGYSLTQPTEFFAGSSRPGTAPGYETVYSEDIRRARRQADYVIVSFHWGTEGRKSIQPYQRAAARKAIEAGADVIIGHHPHVLRGIERYKGGIVFYSLGNFAFASKGSADTGAMLRLRLGDGKREAELLPLDINHQRVGFQPQFLTGERAAAVIREFNSLSKQLNAEIRSKDGRYLVAF